MSFGNWDPPIETAMDKIVATLVLLFMLGSFLLAAYHIGNLVLSGILYAEDQRAQAECYKWALQAKEHPSFYLTPAQEAQCNYQNIDIWNY